MAGLAQRLTCFIRIFPRQFFGKVFLVMNLENDALRRATGASHADTAIKLDDLFAESLPILPTVMAHGVSNTPNKESENVLPIAP
jgi:hypothetical protein